MAEETQQALLKQLELTQQEMQTRQALWVSEKEEVAADPGPFLLLRPGPSCLGLVLRYGWTFGTPDAPVPELPIPNTGVSVLAATPIR